jgi:hypothetical protein
MIEMSIIQSGDEVSRIVGAALPAYDVEAELHLPESYLWLALVSDGDVLAVHRSITANNCVFLRGVYSFRSTGTMNAYILAKRTIQLAKERGHSRSHIWYEISGRERRIATMLGAQTTTSPLNRYVLPVELNAQSELATTGAIDGDHEPDFYPIWVRDRGACVLYNFPNDQQTPLPIPPEWATSQVPALKFPETKVEIAMSAADIGTALKLARLGGKKVNRCPVLHATIPTTKAALR